MSVLCGTGFVGGNNDSNVVVGLLFLFCFCLYLQLKVLQAFTKYSLVCLVIYIINKMKRVSHNNKNQGRNLNK